MNKVKDINAKLKQLYPDPHTPLKYSNEWELYVAVALSAQQTDVGVNAVTPELFKKYKTLEDYLKVDLEEFDNDIKKINFHKGKSKAILNCAKIVSEKYNGKLPETMDELVALPFIGRKTANVLLQELFGKNEGVVVDTHVRRLSNLFGLSAHKEPEKIEKDLMELVPQKDWHTFALGLVLYGREYCTARCNHIDCPLREFIA